MPGYAGSVLCGAKGRVLKIKMEWWKSKDDSFI